MSDVEKCSKRNVPFNYKYNEFCLEFIQNLKWIVPKYLLTSSFNSFNFHFISAIFFNQFLRLISGSIPLDTRIREASDSGKPIMIADPDGTLVKEQFFKHQRECLNEPIDWLIGFVNSVYVWFLVARRKHTRTWPQKWPTVYSHVTKNLKETKKVDRGTKDNCFEYGEGHGSVGMSQKVLCTY